MCLRPEDEHVVGANLLRNLHVCAVQGADDERAVHGKLHVAGAGRLSACGLSSGTSACEVRLTLAKKRAEHGELHLAGA